MKAFTTAFVVRGVLLWVAVRIAAAFVEIANPTVIQEMFILGVVGAAVLWEAKRRREDLFLANLGIAPSAIVLTSLLGPLLLEVFVP